MARPFPAAIHHTCFLVRNVEGTARRLSDDLGIGPWNVWTMEPIECRVHDQESPYSFRVALVTMGGGRFELIAPHSGRSVYEEHLEESGEGFHHICLAYPTAEAVQEAKDELRRQGRECIQEGIAGDLFDFAYFVVPEIGWWWSSCTSMPRSCRRPRQSSGASSGNSSWSHRADSNRGPAHYE